MNSLFGLAGHNHQAVKTLRHPGFQNQRSLNHGNRPRISAANFLHPFLLPSNYSGMDNLIQLLNTGRLVFPRRTERRFGQAGAIDGAIRVENSTAEMLYYFLVDTFTRLHELVGNRIRLSQMGAERHKHFSHNGFAGSNPARQSDFQQASLIWKTRFTTETRRHGKRNASSPDEENSHDLFLGVSVSPW